MIPPTYLHPGVAADLLRQSRRHRATRRLIRELVADFLRIGFDAKAAQDLATIHVGLESNMTQREVTR